MRFLSWEVISLLSVVWKRYSLKLHLRVQIVRAGYCSIIKLGQRKSDSAPMALIEWVDALVKTEEDEIVAE